MSAPMSVAGREAAPLRVLVLCTRNSARSQLAEALLATDGLGRITAASAGSDPGPGVHPLAVEALAEIGVHWGGRPSQGIDAVAIQPWDAVVTVCDAARGACPYLPTAGVTAHWGLEDPAAAEGGHAEQLHAFRGARDVLREAICGFLAEINTGSDVRRALDTGARVIAGYAKSTTPLHP